MRKVWDEEAWDDYLYWQGQDKKTLKKLNSLIKDIERHPFEGIGKPEPFPDISTPDNEKEKQDISPKEQTEDNPIREQEKEPQNVGNADDYGRGKERYTAFEVQDIFTKVNVKIANEKEMRAVTGASFDTVKSYLNTHASRNGIEATRCRMLTHQYIGHYGDRTEIYMRFNDEEKTLVTVIYEPANSTHSSHVDVVPCQYTVKEIRKMGSC